MEFVFVFAELDSIGRRVEVVNFIGNPKSVPSAKSIGGYCWHKEQGGELVCCNSL